MAVTIKPVKTRKELKQFIRFNYELYKENPYSVPDLYEDMLGTLDPKRNAAFEFCEAEYFLALRDGEIVGRVAAIINNILTSCTFYTGNVFNLYANYGTFGYCNIKSIRKTANRSRHLIGVTNGPWVFHL